MVTTLNTLYIKIDSKFCHGYILPKFFSVEFEAENNESLALKLKGLIIEHNIDRIKYEIGRGKLKSTDRLHWRYILGWVEAICFGEGVPVNEIIRIENMGFHFMREVKSRWFEFDKEKFGLDKEAFMNAIQLLDDKTISVAIFSVIDYQNNP